MSDNWLVKLAAKQPTAEIQFRQQIDAMSFDDLRDFVGPSPTSTIDAFMGKAASAINVGRQLAHDEGSTALFEKSAQDASIDNALVDAVSSLSDDEAIKLAEMLENGTDVEKIAGLMGMAGSALKSLGGMAVKHPHMASAAGGAALGAAMGGPGNRMGGALAGGVAGGAASKLIPGMAGKIQQGGFAAGLKGQSMMGKMAQDEVHSLYKTAMCSILKAGYGNDSDTTWLTQFEGSPLLPQAIELAQHEVQTEIESIQKRQQRHAMLQQESAEDDWTKQDIIRAQKHLLELQLVAQRNGLGQQPEQPAAPEQGSPQQAPQSAPPQAQQSQAPQGVGGPGGAQQPMGNEKQASAAGAIAGSLGGALGGAVKPGIFGGLAGAGLGALTAPKGESGERAKDWGKKGLMIGGGLGALRGAVGGGVMGHALTKAANIKKASLPFAQRR